MTNLSFHGKIKEKQEICVKKEKGNIVCPHCGKIIPNQAKMCPVCGKSTVPERTGGKNDYLYVKVIKDQADFYRDYRYVEGYYGKAVGIAVLMAVTAALLLTALFFFIGLGSAEIGILILLCAFFCAVPGVILMKKNRDVTLAMRKAYQQYQKEFQDTV